MGRRYGAFVCVLAAVWASFVVVHPVARKHLLPGWVYPVRQSTAHLWWAALFSALAFIAVALLGRRLLFRASTRGVFWLALLGTLAGAALFSAAFGTLCLVERDGLGAAVSPGSWIFGAGSALTIGVAAAPSVYAAALCLALVSAWLLRKAVRSAQGSL